jgi:hypothetical protein
MIPSSRVVRSESSDYKYNRTGELVHEVLAFAIARL